MIAFSLSAVDGPVGMRRQWIAFAGLGLEGRTHETEHQEDNLS